MKRREFMFVATAFAAAGVLRATRILGEEGVADRKFEIVQLNKEQMAKLLKGVQAKRGPLKESDLLALLREVGYDVKRKQSTEMPKKVFDQLKKAPLKRLTGEDVVVWFVGNMEFHLLITTLQNIEPNENYAPLWDALENNPKCFKNEQGLVICT